MATGAKLVPATGLDHVLWEIHPLTLLRIPASFEHLAQQLGAMLIYVQGHYATNPQEISALVGSSARARISIKVTKAQSIPI